MIKPSIRLAAVSVGLGLVLAVDEGLSRETRAAAPVPGKPTPAQQADMAVKEITPDQFNKLRALIKPKPGGFDDIRWLTDLWEARKRAAAEGKPILIWVGDGHPLGWT